MESSPRWVNGLIYLIVCLAYLESFAQGLFGLASFHLLILSGLSLYPQYKILRDWDKLYGK